MLKVLIACEMSGRVRSQFAKRGWDAWSADLLPDETDQWNERAGIENLGRHYQGDVLDIIREDWDLVIAHPPCTDLSQAGARYWKQKQADGRQRKAIQFFKQMLYRSPSDAYVAVENPRGIMSSVIGDPDQVVEPWMFGDPLKKETCLWYGPAVIALAPVGYDPPEYKTDRLPHLVPTHSLSDYPDGVSRTVTGGGSWRTDKAHGKTGMNKNWEDSQGRSRRHILRSITPEGFARAAAEQWGSYVESLRA
jgi:site-specific DNA-cytosine methylase